MKVCFHLIVDLNIYLMLLICRNIMFYDGTLRSQMTETLRTRSQWHLHVRNTSTLTQWRGTGWDKHEERNSSTWRWTLVTHTATHTLSPSSPPAHFYLQTIFVPRRSPRQLIPDPTCASRPQSHSSFLGDSGSIPGTRQLIPDHQGPDFDDMSSFFPCEIDDVIQYTNLEYGPQALKLVILKRIFRHFL